MSRRTSSARRADGLEVGAVRGDEGESLVGGQLRGRFLGDPQRGGDVAVEPRARRGDRLADRVPAAVDVVEVAAPIVAPSGGVDGLVQVGAAAADQRCVGFLPWQAHRLRVGGEAVRAGQRGHVGCQARVEPGLGQVRRMGGEPLAQDEPGGCGLRGQHVEVRPGALGVDVVGRQRRHPAEVVDAGGEQRRGLGEVDQVGRGLHAHPRAHHQPGHGDRGEELVEVDVGGGAHGGVVLGPEVLDDHLLHVPVPPVAGPDREDGLGPLADRLADAHEKPCGEGDPVPAGVLEHPQAHGRVLVGAADVGGDLGGRLEHHPHRRGDRLEPLQLRPGHDAGVEVRQQPGLLQHRDGAGADVGQRVVVAGLVEPGAGRVPAVLGAVPEGEERLLAAEGRALACDVEHLVHRKVGRGQPARHRGERAVVAAVAAQPGQRDEDLARVGDDGGTAGVDQALVADPRRRGAQRG